MGDFEDSVAAWRDEPFPRGSSTSEALDELHADLVLADTWVAETVLPYVTRGAYVPAQIDIAAGLRELQARADRLRCAGSLADRRLADSYRDYALLQHRAYEELLNRVAGTS
jgi:hypothetical protein